MGDVHRLPVQHCEKPHCSKCGRDMPTFADSSLIVSKNDIRDFKLRWIDYRVVCPCGTEWVLRKQAIT